ncbi:MAG TPA: hypothetical protein PLZ58_00710 [Candidatus Saccharibacteria bacterium]|nr:hypothetical protein [Candidatus Saccharibacteria bacterium]HRQ07158.1 hypothetical protein [Candidatus Saccharibacteria bacterium]
MQLIRTIYKLYIVVLLSILLVAVGLTGAVSAKQATFSQLILPINCVFMVVDTGTGTIEYLTPKECGVIEPPVASTDSTNNNDTSQDKTNKPSWVLNNFNVPTPSSNLTNAQNCSGDESVAPINLPDNPDVDRGIIVQAKLGQTCYFYTPVSTILHSFYVQKIDYNGVLMKFSDLAEPIKLELKKPTKLDLNNSRLADISLELTDLKLPNVASIEVNLIARPIRLTQSRPAEVLSIPIASIGVLAIAVAVVYPLQRAVRVRNE